MSLLKTNSFCLNLFFYITSGLREKWGNITDCPVSILPDSFSDRLLQSKFFPHLPAPILHFPKKRVVWDTPHRIILADEHALFDTAFRSGNQKQRERNMLAVSSKVIIEGRRSGDLTARLSHFLYGLVPHYFRQIIYSRSLVFYSRRYGRSECISPICTKKKEMKETIISIPLLSSPTSRTAESPVLTSYVAVRDNVRKSFFIFFGSIDLPRRC